MFFIFISLVQLSIVLQHDIDRRLLAVHRTRKSHYSTRSDGKSTSYSRFLVAAAQDVQDRKQTRSRGCAAPSRLRTYKDDVRENETRQKTSLHDLIFIIFFCFRAQPALIPVRKSFVPGHVLFSARAAKDNSFNCLAGAVGSLQRWRMSRVSIESTTRI